MQTDVSKMNDAELRAHLQHLIDTNQDSPKALRAVAVRALELHAAAPYLTPQAFAHSVALAYA